MVQVLRSWTGYEMYRITLKHSKRGYRMCTVQITQSQQQHLSCAQEIMDMLSDLLKYLLKIDAELTWR